MGREIAFGIAVVVIFFWPVLLLIGATAVAGVKDKRPEGYSRLGFKK